MKKLNFAFVFLFLITSTVFADFILPPPPAMSSGITDLTGDVSATGPGSAAATINSVGGQTAANVAAGSVLANAATSANTASAIVKRDSSGDFSAGALTFNTTSAIPYKLTSLPFGIANLIGQTSGQGAFLALYPKDGDGTDSVTFVAHAKGDTGFAGADEFLQMGWTASLGTFAIETGNFNGGTLRPLTLRTGQGGATTNPDQIVLNTDGSFTHGGTTGQQEYIFSRSTDGAPQNMSLQGQTSGTNAAFQLFAKDGDGTDTVEFSVFGLGTPSSQTNREVLRLHWDPASSQYRIRTAVAGTGVNRPLELAVGANTNQVRLNTNGTVSYIGQQQGPAGSAGTPTWSFSGDTNTGLYSAGADIIGMSTGGTLRMSVSTTSVTSTLPFLAPAGSAAAPSQSFSADTDTGFYSSAANEVSVSAGGTQIAKFNSTGVDVVSGSVRVSTTGQGLFIKDGTNGKIGQATLVAGTVTVSNTSVTANSRIFLSVSTASGTQGFLSYVATAGVGFTINSTSVTETSVIDWLIMESIP